VRRAGREAAGRLDEPALREMTVPHPEPGQERRAVQPECLPPGLLGGGLETPYRFHPAARPPGQGRHPLVTAGDQP